MAEQITWTHLAERVRRQLDELDMRPVGSSDAEVVYNFALWLMGQNKTLGRDLAEAKNYGKRKTQEVEHLRNLVEARKGKTKQRLSILEEQVAKLLEAADL